MRVLRVALERVLTVQSNILAGLILTQDVDTSAIGGNPDVSLAVFCCLVGSIAAQRPYVVLLVADVLYDETSLVGRYLEHTVVLVAHPVVALRVHRHSVGTADGLAVLVLGNGGQQRAVVLIDKDASALVAEKSEMAILVIAHSTDFVIHRLVRLRHHQRTADGSFQYLQLLQAATDG